MRLSVRAIFTCVEGTCPFREMAETEADLDFVMELAAAHQRPSQRTHDVVMTTEPWEAVNPLIDPSAWMYRAVLDSHKKKECNCGS